MTVHLPVLRRSVTDLCAHYRRSGFRAEPVGGGMVARASLTLAGNSQNGSLRWH